MPHQRSIVEVVYHYNPTSNRNRYSLHRGRRRVVYHYNPTSNRNHALQRGNVFQLYIIIILHQTATLLVMRRCTSLLYIIIILHQTATLPIGTIALGLLYIIIILHQTATTKVRANFVVGCISL